MLGLGAAFLIVGTVIGRPFCRFLCPYGAVLAMASMVSRWHVKIYPDVCVSCHLCGKSCPVNAIQTPAPRPAAKELRAGKRRLAGTLALVPVLVVVASYIGGRFGPTLARLDETVKLATLVAQVEKAGADATTPGAQSDEYTAFQKTGQRPAELYARADAIRHNFVIGGWVLGAWVGLIIGAKLVGLSRSRARTDYETDNAGCVACGRCFDYCPKEYERRGEVGTPSDAPDTPAPELVTLTVQNRTQTTQKGTSA
jgi:ferredoxin